MSFSTYFDCLNKEISDKRDLRIVNLLIELELLTLEKGIKNSSGIC